MSDKMNCILLCGGKGTRMQSKTKHKVCFEIDGVPSILRTMNNFEQTGMDRFIVVVGALAGQVIDCIGSRYPQTAFVYQPNQRGTGNAAKVGFNLMKTFEIDGPVVITMGDKITDTAFIRRATEVFHRESADLLICTQPMHINPTGGRIVVNTEGVPVGVVEQPDTKKALLYKYLKETVNKSKDETALLASLEAYAETLMPSAKKRDKVLAEIRTLDFSDKNALYNLAADRAMLRINGKLYEPEYVDASENTNASFYILSERAAAYALKRIGDNNAQNEEYLTDILEILSAAGEYRIVLEGVRDENEIMSFNNAQELLAIEEYYTRRRTAPVSLPGGDAYKTVREWIALFEAFDVPVRKALTDIYGRDETLIRERRDAYLAVLFRFKKEYGPDRLVILSRAPGRINLMGRHIDHRGGNVNVMSINKEVLVVAARREDDAVTIVNTADNFERREFRIGDHLVDLDWDSWLGYLECPEIRKLLEDTRGDWMNYAKAPILRIQYMYKDRRLNGMDMAISGNIPIAAGLSSSSAIVVAVAEALCALNGLIMEPSEFVELCGEGEWYVGSRGGAADHAAMKFARRGQVVKLGFLPFQFEGVFPFPTGCKLVIANSFVRANKTTNAKDAFNSRVAAFEVGMILLREKFPQYRGVLKHLRDINSETLGLDDAGIYAMLMALPEEISSDELYERIPAEHHPFLDRLLASHTPPEKYRIRTVILYGVAECRRAKICSRMLENGEVSEFGRLMNISHDGDRVVHYDEYGQGTECDSSLSEKDLARLIFMLADPDPTTMTAALIENQPGGYACSTPEIDFLADTALRVPGVLGAQISGAGLGGCLMVLVKDEAVDELVRCLNEAYYVPRLSENGLTVCVPVNSSGIFKV